MRYSGHFMPVPFGDNRDRVMDSELIRLFDKINVEGDCHWPIDYWFMKLFLASDSHRAWPTIILK